MTSLGYSFVPGANHNNQILQPTGLANPSNSNFNDPYPQFSSKMGAAAGCIGPTGGSAASLKAIPGYNMEKQTGGKHGDRGSHVRGGYKKRRSKASRSNAKKSHAKKSHAKKSKKSKTRKHAHRKRSMRGGLSSLSPAPFSGGANAPYHQFTGGEPVSFNYGIGSATPLPLNEIGTANNMMNNIHNNCGSDHGLINLIK